MKEAFYSKIEIFIDELNHRGLACRNKDVTAT